MQGEPLLVDARVQAAGFFVGPVFLDAGCGEGEGGGGGGGVGAGGGGFWLSGRVGCAVWERAQGFSFLLLLFLLWWRW